MDVCPPTCIEFTRADDAGFYGSLFRGDPVDGLEEGGPKTWMMERPFLPIQERCTGCQVCVRECPTNAITVEPDTSKPASLRPRPVIVRREAIQDDGRWHPLSDFTRDYLKRPVRSPWSAIAEWTPMSRERGVSQTWKSMEG